MKLILALLMLTSSAFAGVSVGIVCKNGSSATVDSDLGVSAFNQACRGKAALAAVTNAANAGAIAADFSSSNDADVFGSGYVPPTLDTSSLTTNDTFSGTTTSLSTETSLTDAIKQEETISKDTYTGTTTTLTNELTLTDAIKQEETITKDTSLLDSTSTTTFNKYEQDLTMMEKADLMDTTNIVTQDSSTYDTSLSKESTLIESEPIVQESTKTTLTEPVVYEERIAQEPILQESTKTTYTEPSTYESVEIISR